MTERNDNRLADISSQLQQQHPSSSHQPSGTSPQGMCGVSNVSAGASSNSANMSAALGWGLTPSGNGAIPPSLLLLGMPTFGNPGRQGQLSSQWPSQQPSHSAVQFPSLQQALYLWVALVTFQLPVLITAPQAAGGVVVSHTSPPIPYKLALKIWRGEFIDLNLLLPHRLGAPEPTLAEALQAKGPRDHKQISTIEQWVVCFNAFISVVAVQAPQRVQDLLAYSTLITKAAHDYEGTPWLSYDSHFRTLAATLHLANWSQIDQSLWSQHFNRAIVRKFTPSQRGKDRANPYRVPICMKFNKEGCRSPSCSYRHVCLSCHGQHAEHSCGSSRKESAGGKLPFRREVSH